MSSFTKEKLSYIQDINNSIDNNLGEYATKNTDSYRLNKVVSNKENIRLDFSIDVDRILHSITYNKLVDKTQVNHNPTNSAISKRGIHVQLVSKVARTISRYLNLNEDLTEAIALAHDVGHTPFGHTGEHILNDLMIEFNNTYFNHNVHSIRVLMYIENKGEGLNLTFQTLDGIICHNGEFAQNNLVPIKKSSADLLYDYDMSYKEKGYVSNLISSTLEGCVVRISDIIAYLGRDIEDAILLNKFDRNNIPKHISDILGNTNSSIINTIIVDIINNSSKKNSITMSDEVFNCIKELKSFNYEHIYNLSMSNEELEILKNKFREIFISCVNAIDNKDYNHIIYKMFLNDMNEKYTNSFNKYEKTCDFIAGITDNDFYKVYNLI